MSAVGPGAFSMIWLRYLPRPSWVIPRSTVTPSVRDLLEDVGVVRLGVDRLGQVLADLVLVDVEGGHELDVADVVAAEVDVHQARDEVVLLGVLVVVAALDEAARAVADADDGDPDLAVLAPARHPPRCWSASPPLLPFLPLVAHGRLRAPVTGRRGGGGRLGLAADMEDPLDDGDDGADRDDRRGRAARMPRLADARPGDDEAERRDHEADLAGHEPDGGHPVPAEKPRPSDLARA